MKKKIAYVLSLVLVLSIGFSVGAIASNGTKTATLFYRDIKITLDGKELIPKDVDGNYVEPFIIDGTTYLPVRGISNALGLNVDWDGVSGTVILTTPTNIPSGSVLFEKNDVKITYLGLVSSDSYLGGYDVKLQIENNSSKDYIVQIRDLSVNGFMTDSVFSCEVAAGKKANDEIRIYKSALDKNNITRHYIDDYMVLNQIVANNLLEVTTMDLLIEFARIGLGIGCVIKEFVKEDLDSGRLVQLKLDTPIHKRTIGFLWQSNRTSKALDTFIRFCRAQDSRNL